MTAELVRFGVAMDADLLHRFDERITARGYTNRSEALRDLVRADLVNAHLEGDGLAVATLTLVYDHHVRELTEKLTEMQHDLGEHVVSTLHVHLDHDHCLEIIVMRGPASLIQSAADRLLATKGVEHGRLVATALPTAAGHDHHHHAEAHADAPPPHEHAHEAPPEAPAPAARKRANRGR